MKLIMEAEHGDTQSRVAYVRIIEMQLRLFDLWRAAAGGQQEALVQMAVGAIIGGRFTRAETDPTLRNMATPVPTGLASKCNLSSISFATGLNRETVRRVVNRLIERGPLVRGEDGSINFRPGWTQGPEATQLNKNQLDEFRRTANLLVRDGVISITD
jgi:hypothetical protein